MEVIFVSLKDSYKCVAKFHLLTQVFHTNRVELLLKRYQFHYKWFLTLLT